MNQKPLSFFFSNYDFKDFKATNADEGFVENHVNDQYAEDERPVLRLVRRFVRELSGHPDINTDFFFDAGGHDGYWRRQEGYRVNLGDQMVMKVTIQMGEDAGTYDLAPATFALLAGVADQNKGKRFVVSVDNEPGQPNTIDLDYMYVFSQIRNLVSQLSGKCVFKVEEDRTGLALTIMPLTEGLAKFQEESLEGKEAPESTGTFVKIQLKNVA
jgi:hypothetical protein